MGKTRAMEETERRKRELELKKQYIPRVEVLTDEMKELAGLNKMVVPDFSSGTAGLRIINKKTSEVLVTCPASIFSSKPNKKKVD